MTTLIADIALAVTVVLGLGSVAALALRRGSPALRHAAWRATLAGMWLAPIAVIAAGMLPVQRPEIAVTVPRYEPAPALVAEAPSAPVEAPMAPAPEVAPAAEPAPAPREPLPVAAILLGLWGAGALVALVAFGRDATALRTLLAEGAPSDRPATVEAIAERLGLARLPRVRRSAEVSVPAVAGWLRPTLVLPESGRADEAALIHELAHVQRGDVPTLAAARLTAAVWWWHPLAWLMLRGLAATAEEACDDVVLALTGARREYAQMLTDWAERTSVAGAVNCGSRGKGLVARVRRVLDEKVRPVVKLTMSARILVITCGVVAVLAAGTLGVRVAASNDVESSGSPVVREWDGPEPDLLARCAEMPVDDQDAQRLRARLSAVLDDAWVAESTAGLNFCQVVVTADEIEAPNRNYLYGSYRANGVEVRVKSYASKLDVLVPIAAAPTEGQSLQVQRSVSELQGAVSPSAIDSDTKATVAALWKAYTDLDPLQLDSDTPLSRLQFNMYPGLAKVYVMEYPAAVAGFHAPLSIDFSSDGRFVRLTVYEDDRSRLMASWGGEPAAPQLRPLNTRKIELVDYDRWLTPEGDPTNTPQPDGVCLIGVRFLNEWTFESDYVDRAEYDAFRSQAMFWVTTQGTTVTPTQWRATEFRALADRILPAVRATMWSPDLLRALEDPQTRTDGLAGLRALQADYLNVRDTHAALAVPADASEIDAEIAAILDTGRDSWAGLRREAERLYREKPDADELTYSERLAWWTRQADQKGWHWHDLRLRIRQVEERLREYSAHYDMGAAIMGGGDETRMPKPQREAYTQPTDDFSLTVTGPDGDTIFTEEDAVYFFLTTWAATPVGQPLREVGRPVIVFEGELPAGVTITDTRIHLDGETLGFTGDLVGPRGYVAYHTMSVTDLQREAFLEYFDWGEAPEPESGTGTVKVRARFADGSRPLPARCFIYPEGRITRQIFEPVTVGADGDWTIYNMPPGEWHVSVTGPGFPGVSPRWRGGGTGEDLTVQVSAGETEEVSVTLTRGGTVTGEVVGPDGDPAAGLEVGWVAGGPSMAYTESDGS